MARILIMLGVALIVAAYGDTGRAPEPLSATAQATVFDCFFGESEQPGLGGQAVAHGLAAGDPMPDGITAELRRRGDALFEYEVAIVSSELVVLSAPQPLQRRPDIEEMTLHFQLIKPFADDPQLEWTVVYAEAEVHFACDENGDPTEQ